MWQVIMIYLSLTFSGLHATCYDKYNDRAYNPGDRFMRDKPMPNSSLTGRYDCTCRNGGLLYCTAVDIPCYDYLKKTYVSAEERVAVNWRGNLMYCVCKGGRGRFESCFGCKDQITGKHVQNGEYFTTNSRQYTQAKCRCSWGHADIGSCQDVAVSGPDLPPTGCVDEVSGRSVQIGQQYNIYDNRNRMKFLCRCGTSGQPQRGTCQRVHIQPVVDPCRSGRANCDPRARCTPRGARYSCTCETGYTGNGFSCSDIDECSGRLNTCSENAICTNTAGSFTCACKNGYTGDGFQCEGEISVDQCAENVVFCDLNAICEPTDTSFVCICNTGYTGEGFTCEDHDECTANAHGCDSNATCRNTIGSYMCFCNNGYHGDGYSCSQMCRDETTGTFVRQHDIFMKIRNGIEVRCTCAEDGGAVEGSCIGEEIPELEIGGPCRDDVTGKLVAQGEFFTKRFGNVESRCRCRDSDVEPGSCQQATKLTEPTTAPSIHCVDRRSGAPVAEGDSYALTRAGKNYRCVCTRSPHSPIAISKCRRVRSRRQR